MASVPLTVPGGRGGGRGGGPAGAGSSSSTSLPCPGALRTWTSPPCARATALARSRYIPALSFVEQPPTYTETYLVQRFQASLSAFSAVWNFMALMAVLFWLLFYAL